jgi:hypothetical protein
MSGGGGEAIGAGGGAGAAAAGSESPPGAPWAKAVPETNGKARTRKQGISWAGFTVYSCLYYLHPWQKLPRAEALDVR